MKNAHPVADTVTLVGLQELILSVLATESMPVYLLLFRKVKSLNQHKTF